MVTTSSSFEDELENRRVLDPTDQHEPHEHSFAAAYPSKLPQFVRTIAMYREASTMSTWNWYSGTTSTSR
jgi:hypothetical protein